MRFQFSIRDLLWLTLVVALAFGWMVREYHLEERRRFAIEKCVEEWDKDRSTWWGALNTLEHAIKQHGYFVLWNGTMTGMSIRAPDGRETVYKVVDFAHPNRTSK